MTTAVFRHRAFQIGDGKDIDLNGQIIVGSGNGSDFTKVRTGNYTGDSTVNRAIAHGLGVTPKLILFRSSNGYYRSIVDSLLSYMDYSRASFLAVTAPDATNFYVGNATAYDDANNLNTVPYTWVAIG